MTERLKFEVLPEKGHKGTFWGSRNSLHLEFEVVTNCIHSANTLSYELKTRAF